MNCFQVTVFRMGSEGQQDMEMAILTALLKGELPGTGDLSFRAWPGMGLCLCPGKSPHLLLPGTALGPRVSQAALSQHGAMVNDKVFLGGVLFGGTRGLWCLKSEPISICNQFPKGFTS